MGLNYAGVLSLIVPDQSLSFAGFASSFGLMNAPLWFVEPTEGAIVSSAAVGSFALGALFPESPDLDGKENGGIRSICLNAALKTSMWSGYEAYAAARGRHPEPGPGWEHVPIHDLIAAPWDANNLSRVSAWLPLAAYAGAAVGISLARDREQTAVWESGAAFWGSCKVPILLGLCGTLLEGAIYLTFTGVGEEALYRGVQYEELKLSFGPLPAKILDSTLFAGIHVPQEINAGETWSDVLLGFAFRGLLSLGLEWAYDDGGLRASVAQHFWIDMISRAAGFLFGAGAAESADFTAGGRFAPSLDMTIEL
jgi:membrane protease YdiL (CAAX protease family)